MKTMSVQRILVGAAGAFAAVMLALTAYIALDASRGRDLTDVQKTRELASDIEQVKTDVAKNLARAKSLAEAVRRARRDVDAPSMSAFAESAAVKSEPTRPSAQPLLYTGAAVRGVALSAEGNMAVIDGDVYGEGDWFDGMKVVTIHDDGVILETPQGESREIKLSGLTRERDKR